MNIELIEDLKEGINVKIINYDIWTFFASIYKQGIPIIRYAYRDSDLIKKIEIYPLKVLFFIFLKKYN